MSTLQKTVNTPLTTRQKLFYQILLCPMEAAVFCLFWNIFKVNEAVGHGLGTVNFFTAMGVDYVVSGIVSAWAIAFWSAKFVARRYSVYTNKND